MSGESRYSATGLGILVVLVAVAAVWMFRQSHRVEIQAAMPAITSGPALPDGALGGFVEIPAGAFRMGSDPRADRMAYANERWSAGAYQGNVDMPEFYIGRNEVTVAQYRAYASVAGLAVGAEALAGEDALPVANVSWTDALGYAHWLQNTVRSQPDTAPQLAALLNDGWNLTLPNEAQWEKAARGGDARVFPWGNAPEPGRANINSGHRVPVGSIACDSCSYGLHDMSGNVWELTRSPYREYPFDKSADRAVKDGDALYVMRGGSFSDAINNARAATRGGVDPGARRNNIGFRLALTRQ